MGDARVLAVLAWLAIGNVVVYRRTRYGAHPSPSDSARIVILVLWPLWLVATIGVRKGWRDRA